MNVAAAVTVRRGVEEVYEFWRDFKNFPVFMRRLEAVEEIGGGRSRWRVRGPAGMPVEWDAEIISDQPGHMISWRSLPDSSVPNRGAVRFEPAPGARGTEIHVELSYEPPAGSLGAGVAWLFGTSPRQQVREGLRRVKQMLEVGEIPLSERPSASGPAAPPTSVDKVRDLMGVQS
jgi:uncharacterized membrane protein